MCVGCRQKALKEELERFIFHEDAGLVFDLRRKAPGRGTYVHAAADCIRQAVERGGFSRGFKTRVIADADEVLEDVIQGIRRRLDEALRIALQSQKLRVGATATSDALKREEVGLLLLAADAGDSTRMKFASNAERKNIPVSQVLTGEHLGAITGRDFVAVLGVVQSRPLARIRQDLDKLAQLDAL